VCDPITLVSAFNFFLGQCEEFAVGELHIFLRFSEQPFPFVFTQTAFLDTQTNHLYPDKGAGTFIKINQKKISLSGEPIR
jgi:hypothetical protein